MRDAERELGIYENGSGEEEGEHEVVKAIEDHFDKDSQISSLNESSEWNSEKVRRQIKEDYNKEQLNQMKQVGWADREYNE